MRLCTRKTVPYIVVGMICCIIVAGCPGGGGDGGTDSNNNPEPGSNINTTIYNGKADIIIDYYDYNFFGNLIFIEQKSYQHNVAVETGPPKNVGSIYEQNAINLQIMTTTMGGEGTFGMSSAILNVALQGGPVLLQYWDLNYANQLIDGTLVDTHIAESAAANQLYAWEDLAGFISVLLFYMDTGTHITGRLSSDVADIQIDGQTTDGTRIFSIDVQANN